MAYSAETLEQNLLNQVGVAAGVNSADQTNPNCRGIKVIFDLTALTGTSMTCTIKGKDPASGKYYTLLASAAIASPATTVLTVYPGATASANVTANDVVPRTFRVETTGTFNPATYTVGYCLIP